MRELDACKLTDVLAEWGSHKTEWRIGRVVTDSADAVEVALTYYAPFVSMILSSEPFACFRVELESGDLPLLRITDGRVVLHDPRDLADEPSE